MDLVADHAFHIGHQHLRGGTPCQDFALSSVTARGAYAVVSDGCSTGGMTDVGARIIALRAVMALTGADPGPLDTAILGMNSDDMLATRVTVWVENGEAAFRIEGDGAYAIRRRSGAIEAGKIGWADNMPCYPIYGERDFVVFIEAQGGDLEAQRMEIEGYARAADGAETMSASTASLGEGLKGHGLRLTIDGDDPITHVAVFTDGVEQVEEFAWHEVIVSLMSFKTGAGEFAKRRMGRFLADASKLGRGPQDDIAFAVIALPG